MADELDDQIRQVFRDAASDAPRAQPLPATVAVTPRRSRPVWSGRLPVAVAAGVLLVVGVGAFVLLRGDEPRIVPPVGTADVPTTAPAPTTADSDAVNGVRRCATTDLRFAVNSSWPLVMDGDTRPLLNITNASDDTCVVDESLLLVFGAEDITRAGGTTETVDLPSVPSGRPAFGASISLDFRSICPEPDGAGQPAFDTVTARMGAGPAVRIPLVGGECTNPLATCDLDQLEASIDDDRQFVLLNSGSEQCEVTVRDIVMLRFDGVTQRAPERAGPDEQRGVVLRIPPNGGSTISLDDYCPSPLNGEEVIGARVVLDGDVALDAAYAPSSEATIEPLCEKSIDPSAPAVALCEAESLAVSVVDGEKDGEPDAIHIDLFNIGRYGDCTMPRDLILRFEAENGELVEIPGPGPTGVSDTEPLPGDVLASGSMAQLRIVNGVGSAEGQCFTEPRTPTLGLLEVSLELPDGTVLDLGGFQGFCSPSYTHVGLPID